MALWATGSTVSRAIFHHAGRYLRRAASRTGGRRTGRRREGRRALVRCTHPALRPCRQRPPPQCSQTAPRDDRRLRIVYRCPAGNVPGKYRQQRSSLRAAIFALTRGTGDTVSSADRQCRYRSPAGDRIYRNRNASSARCDTDQRERRRGARWYREASRSRPAREFGNDDRRRHLYIVGKTGMGKTTLLENLLVADIRAGRVLA